VTAAVTMPQGGSGAIEIEIKASGAFKGNVALSIEASLAQ